MSQRTTATNGDKDATAKTRTAATATTAPGADENYEDLDGNHKYVSTETINNIESKMNYSYDIDKQFSKKNLINATNEGNESILNTRLKKPF